MYAVIHADDSYTYFIMGLSVIGGVAARRFGYITYPFVTAFLLAPTVGFYQKKEADFVYSTDLSR
jgi:hypothetical protein